MSKTTKQRVVKGTIMPKLTYATNVFDFKMLTRKTHNKDKSIL